MDVIEYDIRGQICPATLLFTLRELNSHVSGLQDGTLRISIKTDNRDAITTIPESVDNMGYEVAVNKVDGYYLIEIIGSKG